MELEAIAHARANIKDTNASKTELTASAEEV